MQREQTRARLCRYAVPAAQDHRYRFDGTSAK